MAYNQLQHLRDNIAAIRIALNHRDGITPKPEEYAALAAYAGFGGLKAVLFPAGDKQGWIDRKASQSDLKLYPSMMELHQLLKEGLTDTADKAGNTITVKKFRAIPAVIDGTQKIVQGTVICLKLTDTVTLGGQLYAKGQRIYGSGTLSNQRYTLNIKSIHVGYNFYPVDLTVFDQMDGLEGISVPEAITGDALRDGATSGVQNMDIMSFDPSVTAQLTTAGVNTAKGLFGKKVKQVKGKLKDGHALLLRDNQEVKNSH